ncbi:hypothetical protein WG68_03695 [Arsukibacterium ikkense]|uniref:DUF115 domain-containing protein n=1 Tax=Arsukibacterium ikkense TaxID=336831 RepID=A0A0M2V857_9GAMM|nr:6-hydroxymethylpterin diphosphokinase MptE-like protein [Arsukibacterium ikkense]KKO47042.1 hypothetical protein WG68_03695 [Arsukibacterium ikkense]
MLKYIKYQLDPDDVKQAASEQKAAASIKPRFNKNLQAISQHIPSILPIVQQHSMQQYSVFCTRAAELNIVDFATGRVWYSETPEAEVAREVESFCRHAPYVELGNDATPTEVQQPWPAEALPQQVDVVVMLGLGLGYQINALLQKTKLKYLIVYEPNVDTLICSLQANDWQRLFSAADAAGTQIFLQLDNDGSSVAEDLAELRSVADFRRLYLYRHYCHPVMDKVAEYLFAHSGRQEQLLGSTTQFSAYEDFNDYVAERSVNVLGNLQPHVAALADELHRRNMTALHKFYPKVHDEIDKHQSQHWQAVTDDNGKPNLYHPKRKAFFYQDLDTESARLVGDFTRRPYKDDVLLGQTSVDKFSHYIHYSHIAQTQPLINKQLQQKIQLPKEVDSLIIFGVGLGKHIQLLTEQYQISNLYICEPNLDFFAASLAVTDWAAIFERAEQNGLRIYLNLGGDGSTYFYDLMAQFYQVGAYSIANTYMLCSYFNQKMHKAIADLRAELKVVLALGEYYDHCRYGIAHTYNSVAKQHRFLQYDNSSYRNLPALNLPVFIVGNGPSLDGSFAYLQEHRDKVLLISCGTALYSLYKMGIKPDFHAEVEQNRSTFCWIGQVDDTQYLKDIRLISVNGIHPDTADLFKETLLCFKDGESSTNFFDTRLKKQGVHIASLSYAYPTVTNLVLNYALRLGFKVFYLFGVDLGYADVRQHHSQASAYYRNDGSEVYDYQQTHGGGMPAEGNFLPYVFTKPEFDMSRKLLEQAISKAGRKVEIYNCSNGVKIAGAVPLQPGNILFRDLPQDKDLLLQNLIDTAFYADLSAYAQPIFSQIDFTAFRRTIDAWLALFEEEITTQEQAKAFITKQWRLLQTAARDPSDPTFYLFYGSTNYFGGLMTKIASCISDDTPEILPVFNQVMQVWRHYVQSGSEQFAQQPLKFDDVDVQHLFAKS